MSFIQYILTLKHDQLNKYSIYTIKHGLIYFTLTKVQNTASLIHFSKSNHIDDIISYKDPRIY